MMKKILLILVLFSSVSLLSAQEIATGISPTTTKNDDVQLLYRNEQEFGFHIHSSGWGLNFRKCKHVTGYKKRVLEAEITGLRHPKEIKQDGTEYGGGGNGSGKGYFFGKLHNVKVLRGGFGYHKIITGKSDRRGVELRLLTLAGPSIAFAKPIYLEIWYPDPVKENHGHPEIEKYDPLNPMHRPMQFGGNILGKAGYFNGFNEMNFFPGAFFKLGLSFEHSNLDDDIKLLEVGMTVDAYYKTIPIMANAKNNQVYVNVYFNIMFGKKWF